MATFKLQTEPIREAIRNLDAQQSHQAARAPSLTHIFTPRDHEGALDPRRPIVIGDRGTGKSFWSGVLVHDEARQIAHASFPRLGLNKVEGILAFSEAEDELHPTRSQLQKALDEGFAPEIIWRAVAIWLLGHGQGKPIENLNQLCADVLGDGRAGALKLGALNRSYQQRGARAVLVFDALDRLAVDWNTIRKLTQGVFQLALSIRGFDYIDVKVFLRPDVASDPDIWAITDSSKLRHDQIRLNWNTLDLYGLMFTLLSNDSGSGRVFRSSVSQQLKDAFKEQSLSDGTSRWSISRALAENEATQKDLVSAIGGEFMGRNKKRGRVYTWIPTHLQDARGHATPRSFVLAMQKAAWEARSRETALDAASIQEGVRKASDVRMDELREDYRWIQAALAPLAGMAVPIDVSEIFARWEEADTVKKIKREARSDRDGKYLLPVEMSVEGALHSEMQLLSALDRLAIVSTRADGRRDFPDLFRVAANMKRKGGIPVKR